MASTIHLSYEGYDPTWVLGRDKGPPIETKPKPPAPPPAKKEPAPVELKVPFCCEGCQDKMYARLIELEGVDSVKVDANSDKVTLTGKMKPEDCLKAAKKIVKRSDFWPKKKGEGEKKEEPKKEQPKKADPPAKKEEKKEAAPPAKQEGPPPPIELQATICCEGCVTRLYEALIEVDNVTDVKVNATSGKIIVSGKAKPETVLKVAKKVKPAAVLIPAKKK